MNHLSEVVGKFVSRLLASKGFLYVMFYMQNLLPTNACVNVSENLLVYVTISIALLQWLCGVPMCLYIWQKFHLRSQTEWSFESNLRSFGYSAMLSAQHFGFFWTPATKEISLELMAAL